MRLRLTTDVPTWATKLLSELDEIPNGNGYSALNVNPGSVNWPTETENDGEGMRFLERASRQVEWDASGGDIPSSGDGFMAVVLTDNASDPNVIAYIDLGRARTVLSGTSLTIPSLALRFAEGSLPRGLGGDVATSPQSAYLNQGSSVEDQWYEVLDYEDGGGFLHSLLCNAVVNNTEIAPEFRVTVDGTESVLGFDDPGFDYSLGQSTSSSALIRRINLTLRFDASLKVEVRRTGGPSGNVTLESKTIYSTDI